MKYRIRRAELKDRAQTIRRLHAICFPSDAPLNPKQGWWWIVWHGGEAVGFAGMVLSVQWADAAYLFRAGVLPEHRGKGLQQRLVRARLALAKSIGMRWVITDTRQNPSSANNLIDCGFRTFIPSRPWSFRDATYWKRRLDH